jgi:hypothetical protein
MTSLSHMRQQLWLCLMVIGCSSGLEPSSPRVLVRQQLAEGSPPLTTATVQGDVLVVEGRFSLADRCRTLRGVVEEQPGALLLNVIAGRPRTDCPRIPGEYDYEVRIGPLAQAAFS